MRFTLNNSDKVQQLIEIFKLIKNLSSHCTLFCKNNEIYIQTMDGSHVCLLDVKIKKSWFDGEYSSTDEILSFSSNTIVKILGLYVLNSTLTIESDKNGDEINISMVFPDNITKDFTIPLMDIDTELLYPEECEYSMECIINSKSLDKYMQELMLFGDVLSIKCIEDTLYLKSGGQEGKCNIKIPNDVLDEFIVDEGIRMKVKADIRYISYISKLHGVFKQIHMKCDNQFPLKFHFSNIDDGLFIHFFIAPKIDENEDDDVSDEENIVVDSIQDKLEEANLVNEIIQ